MLQFLCSEQTFSIPHSYFSWQTEDRQTTCRGNTALYVASRGNYSMCQLSCTYTNTRAIITAQRISCFAVRVSCRAILICVNKTELTGGAGSSKRHRSKLNYSAVNVLTHRIWLYVCILRLSVAVADGNGAWCFQTVVVLLSKPSCWINFFNSDGSDDHLTLSLSWHSYMRSLRHAWTTAMLF